MTCSQSAQNCANQAEAMAQQPLSLEDILNQVIALQGQLTTCQQVNQNLQNQLNTLQNAPIQPTGEARAGVSVGCPPPQSRQGSPHCVFSHTRHYQNLVGLINY